MKGVMQYGQASCRLAFYAVLSGFFVPCLVQAEGVASADEHSVIRTAEEPYRLMLNFSNMAHTVTTDGYTFNQGSVPPGAGAGAGLIGALVGAMIIRTTNASRAGLAERMNTLNDRALFFFQSQLSAELQKLLESRKLETVAVLELVNDPLDLEQPGLARRIQENRIMTGELSCQVDETLRRLTMSLNMKTWRKGELRPIHIQLIDHISTVESVDEIESAFLQWTGEDNKLLSEQVSQGAQVISNHLVNALFGIASVQIAGPVK